jgi:hypothetical protein
MDERKNSMSDAEFYKMMKDRRIQEAGTRYEQIGRS